MLRGSDFRWLVLYILLSKVSPCVTCTFSKVSDQFTAILKLQIVIGNEEECILACYEESDCVYVVHAESLCSIYTEGNEVQKALSTVFKLDRQLLRSSCPRRVEVGVHMPFPKYRANNDERVCMDSDSLPTTTISMYKSNGLLLREIHNPDANHFRFLLEQVSSFLKDILMPGKRDHRRLFFGSVYNVTGYYFMNGYAFADRCVGDDGACCGREELVEVKIGGQYTYEQALGKGLPTEVDQPFFVVAHE